MYPSGEDEEIAGEMMWLGQALVQEKYNFLF